MRFSLKLISLLSVLSFSLNLFSMSSVFRGARIVARRTAPQARRLLNSGVPNGQRGGKELASALGLGAFIVAGVVYNFYPFPVGEVKAPEKPVSKKRKDLPYIGKPVKPSSEELIRRWEESEKIHGWVRRHDKDYSNYLSWIRSVIQKKSIF